MYLQYGGVEDVAACGGACEPYVGPSAALVLCVCVCVYVYMKGRHIKELHIHVHKLASFSGFLTF